MEELDKKYDHNKVEENKYETWLNKGYFKCDPQSKKKPFTNLDPFGCF